MPPNREEVDGLLLPLGPVLAHEADALLDLRELLMSNGHPGKCARCIFRLFTAASTTTEALPRIAPLRSWIEQHLEISVRAGGTDLEAMPVKWRQGETLEEFCLRSIQQVRFDRSYRAARLELAFRYKSAA